MSYLGVILSFAVVNNVVLAQLFGVYPLLAITRRLRSSLAVGCAITIVSTVAALLSWTIERFVLAPLGVSFLQVIVAVLSAAGVAQLVDWMVYKTSKSIYSFFGASFPLVAVNSAVVGISLITMRGDYNPLQCFSAGVGGGIGATLAVVLMALIRNRLELERIPRPFRGTPMMIITAGLMAMAFMAFDKSFLVRLLG